MKNKQVIVSTVVNGNKEFPFDLSINRSQMAFPQESYGFTRLLNSVDLIAIIGNAISQILHYRYQIRALEVEARRIEREAEIKHHQIEKAFEITIKIIEENRKTLEASFQVTAENLRNIHIQRTQITRIITELSKGLLSPELSFDEKQLISSTIKEMSSLSVNIGQQGCTSLQVIAENTQKSFESLPQLTQLLTYKKE